MKQLAKAKKLANDKILTSENKHKAMLKIIKPRRPHKSSTSTLNANDFNDYFTSAPEKIVAKL